MPSRINPVAPYVSGGRSDQFVPNIFFLPSYVFTCPSALFKYTSDRLLLGRFARRARVGSIGRFIVPAGPPPSCTERTVAATAAGAVVIVMMTMTVRVSRFDRSCPQAPPASRRTDDDVVGRNRYRPLVARVRTLPGLLSRRQTNQRTDVPRTELVSAAEPLESVPRAVRRLAIVAGLSPAWRIHRSTLPTSLSDRRDAAP